MTATGYEKKVPSANDRTIGFRRRVWVWMGVTGIALAVLVLLAMRHGMQPVFGQALRIGVVIVAWALAVLLWDLAVVWTEYVSPNTGGHLEALRTRWNVPAEPYEPTGEPAEPLDRAPEGARVRELSAEERREHYPWWLGSAGRMPAEAPAGPEEDPVPAEES